ncbi:hypothetical protein RD110_13850 [Rhodoferax koreense]|uniref:DUF72 domain-containing protein n=1 Tax=Rhodoferax koreensis TaxID=1842727 RepID=A0A1P8JWK4_9BURK|nr:DUF72 domain-containing protein [Rhodoferax koreense]APW38146.1 hypothetical protein RD110_13850 [Rhodoferax koreense]
MTNQNALFPEFEDDQTASEPIRVPTPPAAAKRAKAAKAAETVGLVPPDDATLALSEALPRRLRLGTSSWTYPGWAGLVWDGDHAQTALSRHGLAAYGRHPLLRTVSLDRNFYRALTAAQYARYAGQVPDGFRFVVKAPSLVTDALVRAEDGRGMQANPAFLDPELAVQEFALPALEGLGAKIGALVFQLSPLPPVLLGRMPEVLARLARMLAALPALKSVASDAVVAVEVRDPAFVTIHAAGFAAVLREAGATYCLGLHPKLPPIAEQLPMLRALWPGPLVCRWNLNRIHGPYGYEEAEKRYEPFGQVLDPDPETRAALARVVAGTVGRGQNAFVTISNHAEGSAPLTLRAFAQDVADLLDPYEAAGPG